MSCTPWEHSFHETGYTEYNWNQLLSAWRCHRAHWVRYLIILAISSPSPVHPQPGYKASLGYANEIKMCTVYYCRLKNTTYTTCMWISPHTLSLIPSSWFCILTREERFGASLRFIHILAANCKVYSAYPMLFYCVEVGKPPPQWFDVATSMYFKLLTSTPKQICWIFFTDAFSLGLCPLMPPKHSSSLLLGLCFG